MRITESTVVLSATDLSNFLGCRHRTALDMAEAQGRRRRPQWDDPLLELLFKRGLEHERAYVESLHVAGVRSVDLAAIRDVAAALAGTLDAMRGGVDVIVQAALADGQWYGRPDVMRRVESPSGLGVCPMKSPTRSWRARPAPALSCSSACTHMLGV